MTIITYTGSFKYIAPIFLYPEQKQISQGSNHHPSTPNFDSLPYPTPGRKDDPTISCTHLMVKLSVLAGRKITLKGGGNHPPSVDKG